jgi:hypothetical protein
MTNLQRSVRCCLLSFLVLGSWALAAAPPGVRAGVVVSTLNLPGPSTASGLCFSAFGLLTAQPRQGVSRGPRLRARGWVGVAENRPRCIDGHRGVQIH